MNRILTPLCVILCFAAGTSEARQDATLSESEAVGLALENSHLVKSARYQADAAEEALDQVRTLRLPSITARGVYTRLSENVSSLDIELPPGLDSGAASTFELADIELDQVQSEIGVSQPLFTGFRIGSTISSARHTASAAEHEARMQEVDLAYRVRAAYWSLVQAEAAVRAMEKAVEQMEAHVRDVRNRVEEGAATGAELLAVRTRLTEIRADMIDAKNGVHLTRMELNRLTGRPLDAVVQPDPDSNHSAVDIEDRDALMSAAATNHPGLLALDEQTAALGERVGTVRADRFPDVTAFGRYRYSRPNQYFFLDQDEFKGNWEVGISATWTLWNWNRHGSAVAEATARLQSSEARRAEFRETLELDVERRRLEIRRARQSLIAAEEHLGSAEESFRLARGEYELGAALTTRVLDAEASLRAAELRAARARADLSLAHAALLRVLGRIE